LFYWYLTTWSDDHKKISGTPLAVAARRISQVSIFDVIKNAKRESKYSVIAFSLSLLSVPRKTLSSLFAVMASSSSLFYADAMKIKPMADQH
jgi:hypothetical protein